MKSEKRVVLRNKYGFHVRPSTQFMTLAQQFKSAIQVEASQGGAVDGKSVMDLLTLGAAAGDSLSIRADGEDAEEAVARLAELVDGRFGGIE